MSSLADVVFAAAVAAAVSASRVLPDITKLPRADVSAESIVADMVSVALGPICRVFEENVPSKRSPPLYKVDVAMRETSQTADLPRVRICP